jgi:hypothetical protein
VRRRRYAFAGLVVESGFPFPQLPDAGDERARCRVEVRPVGAAASQADPGGEPWEPRVTARGGGAPGFTIEFPGGVRFDVTGSGDAILCSPAAGMPHETIHHLLLDHVLPRVLFLKGALVLHASVLARPQNSTASAAVAFLGASGAGKSTLAASLIGAGWSLVSDDALVIEPGAEGPGALPTYASMRLWPDVAERLAGGVAASPVAHYSEKLRFSASSLGDARAFSRRAVPLARVYVLDDAAIGAAPAIQPVTQGEALRAAFEAQLRLVNVDRPSLQGALDRIAASGVLPLCRRLSFPRALAALPAVHAELRADLSTAAPVHSTA